MSRSNSNSSSVDGENGSANGSGGSGNSDMATVGGGGGGGRMRSNRDNDDDDNMNEEDNDSDYNNDDDHDDPQMSRLLHRLRREHATNFGNQHGGGRGDGGAGSAGGGAAAGGGRVNRTRARYLLEASAGNVGLASALYWEDYLAEAERGDAENGALRDTGGYEHAAAKSSGEGGGGKASAKTKGDDADNNFDDPLEEAFLSSSKKKRGHEEFIGGVDAANDHNSHQQKRYKREDSFGLESSSPFSSSAHEDVVAARKRLLAATKKAQGKKQSGTSSSSAGEDGDAHDKNNYDAARMQEYLRGSTTALSSMHQFQRQLDEKISSLQERLSSYRWQWQNDGAGSAFAAASASHPPDRLASYRTTSQSLQQQQPSSSSSNAAAASAASLGNPNDNAFMQGAISAALQLGSTAAVASSSTSSSGNGINNPSSAAAAAAAAAAYAGPPNLWRMGHGSYRGDGSAFGLGPEDGHRSALFGSLAAGAGAGTSGGMPPRMSIEEIHRAFRALHEGENFPAAVATRRYANSSADASVADAASRPLSLMDFGYGPPPFDWLSRSMPYDSLRVAAAHAAAAGGAGAPPMNEAGQQAVMAALLGEGGNVMHAAAAGARGEGGGDDSDDDASSGDGNAGRGNNGAPRRDEREQYENNHGSNRNNARDGFDDAAGDNDNAGEADDAGEAPLRRSMRIRSARSRSAALNLPPRPRPALAARMRRNHNLDDVDDDDVPPDPEEAPWMVRRALRAAARAALANNNDGSVDISDDDDVAFLPGPMPVFRLKKGKSEDESSPNLSGKRKCPDSNNNEKHNDPVEYSDDDDDSSTISIDVDQLFHMPLFAEPSRQLWGSYPGETDESENDVEDNARDGSVSFPASWLRSGFKLALCGNGLSMSAPPADDRGHNNRSFSVLREGPLKGIKGAFPYNCTSVSALLSIVTALIYSGATIQGRSTVACDVDRVPFHKLSLDQRKREFDSRLTDALSSLIFVAAQAGSLRYKEMLKIYDKQWARRCRKGHVTPEEEDIHTTKRIALQRRSRVCQVCWWPTDVMNGGATIFPEGKDPQDVKFKTSYTNIRDIESYVKTNLRSFKEPGGCALFLETIVHCHGTPIQFSPSSPLSCDPGDHFTLNCKCRQTLKYFQITAKNKSGDNVTMLEDHDCMTVELLSLLLTGHVHRNYENWSADMFGIGILRLNTNIQNKLGPRLLRPIKPIWICMGDLGYSTLFLDMNTFIGSTNLLDKPGKTFQIAHWNCWSGELSKFRLITSMHDEEAVGFSSQKKPVLIPCTSDSEEEEEGRTIAESISARYHREQKRDAPMSWEREGINEQPARVNPHLKPIADDELQSVTFHPEDKKYYPGQYRRWRYQFGNASAADADWTPFYRLHDRQKLIVEMKVAPRICALVRSRWPLATVRDFIPEGKFPLV